MIFWDTSALVPLLVEETNSPLAREVAERDGDLLVWWGTPVEVLSAIARREREGGMSAADADGAREGLALLEGAWSEVLASDEVRDGASRLLRVHPIRASDALQLAAALTWARGRPKGCGMFTFDASLAEAARREGFDLVVPRQ